MKETQHTLPGNKQAIPCACSHDVDYGFTVLFQINLRCTAGYNQQHKVTDVNTKTRELTFLSSLSLVDSQRGIRPVRGSWQTTRSGKLRCTPPSQAHESFVSSAVEFQINVGRLTLWFSYRTAFSCFPIFTDWTRNILTWVKFHVVWKLQTRWSVTFDLISQRHLAEY